jgi:hypothetical protein
VERVAQAALVAQAEREEPVVPAEREGPVA